MVETAASASGLRLRLRLRLGYEWLLRRRLHLQVGCSCGEVVCLLWLRRLLLL